MRNQSLCRIAIYARKSLRDGLVREARHQRKSLRSFTRRILQQGAGK